MHTIYMLSHCLWTDGLILRYATDEAGLERIARDNYYGDQDNAHVEINMDDGEVQIISCGVIVSGFHIFEVEEMK